MTKLTLGSHPHMLGFEQLERLLERTAKTGNEGYPHLISNKHRIVDIELRWLLQGLQKRTCQSLLRIASWSSVDVNATIVQSVSICTVELRRGNFNVHSFWQRV